MDTDMAQEGYVVVFQRAHGHQVFWDSYKDEQDFRHWYETGILQDGGDKPVKEAYHIIEQGISEERAENIIRASKPHFEFL